MLRRILQKARDAVFHKKWKRQSGAHFFRKRTHIKRKEAIRVKWNEQAAPNNHQASADLLAAQSDETEFQYEELSDGGERNKVIQEQKKRRTHL
ncbi:hypothetical protein UZ35_05765 [Heyndrickxia coagulans]|jgi:hypothetical protein|uniref:Uncharacterized protein n=1 Tax=Heyndrickxia coagulans TaxID=1398 RepID=A0AAN0WD16_HEYCO|nr:hypothetical protein SB48_HM08orf04636 [Heyndrickxia coagulans]KXT21170.1 hypothetical protein UZ35_05765 [Heyndrickxia coagulans]